MSMMDNKRAKNVVPLQPETKNDTPDQTIHLIYIRKQKTSYTSNEKDIIRMDLRMRTVRFVRL